MCIQCALSATLKPNFEPLFDFIIFLKEYVKQAIQNSLKMSVFSLPHFHSNTGGRENFCNFVNHQYLTYLPLQRRELIWIRIWRVLMSSLILIGVNTGNQIFI